jgi:hypothetical protein
LETGGTKESWEKAKRKEGFRRGPVEQDLIGERYLIGRGRDRKGIPSRHGLEGRGLQAKRFGEVKVS